MDDGLLLHDAYITAAGRCAPPDNKPLPEELERCRDYLLREIALLSRVKVVVALGRIGFEAYLRACGLRLSAYTFGHAVENQLDDGKILMGSYHPSQQNTSTGRLTALMLHAVFARARQLVES